MSLSYSAIEAKRKADSKVNEKLKKIYGFQINVKNMNPYIQTLILSDIATPLPLVKLVGTNDFAIISEVIGDGATFYLKENLITYDGLSLTSVDSIMSIEDLYEYCNYLGIRVNIN